MADAPDWFWEAIDQTPEDGYVSVEDVELHYLQWGRAEAPGLRRYKGLSLSRKAFRCLRSIADLLTAAGKAATIGAKPVRPHCTFASPLISSYKSEKSLCEAALDAHSRAAHCLMHS